MLTVFIVVCIVYFLLFANNHCSVIEFESAWSGLLHRPTTHPGGGKEGWSIGTINLHSR